MTLGLEVDGEPCIVALPGALAHQRAHQLVAQRDGKDAVVGAVAEEDIGEARRDDAADTEIEQRPGRVFAARAAAEVLVGDQYRRVPPGFPVEHEIRILAAVRAVAQLVEEMGAPARCDGSS